MPRSDEVQQQPQQGMCGMQEQILKRSEAFRRQLAIDREANDRWYAEMKEFINGISVRAGNAGNHGVEVLSKVTTRLEVATKDEDLMQHGLGVENPPSVGAPQVLDESLKPNTYIKSNAGAGKGQANKEESSKDAQMENENPQAHMPAEKLLDELPPDRMLVSPSSRALRCTDVALSVASGLLGVCLPSTGARATALVGGNNQENAQEGSEAVAGEQLDSFTLDKGTSNAHQGQQGNVQPLSDGMPKEIRTPRWYDQPGSEEVFKLDRIYICEQIGSVPSKLLSDNCLEFSHHLPKEVNQQPKKPVHSAFIWDWQWILGPKSEYAKAGWCFLLAENWGWKWAHSFCFISFDPGGLLPLSMHPVFHTIHNLEAPSAVFDPGGEFSAIAAESLKLEVKLLKRGRQMIQNKCFIKHHVPCACQLVSGVLSVGPAGC